MSTMGLVSFMGLCRLGSGLRFQSAALRWGWNRYCHTNNICRRPANPSTESPWWHIIRSIRDDETSDIVPRLDHWFEFQNKEVLSRDLKWIMSRLRDDWRFSLALKIFEWMGKVGICEFSSRDHAVRINLIGKVRGCSAAESYVRNLPEQDRNDKTYGELLHCYVHKHRKEKALYHFQKMKDLGFLSSPCPFNEIMRLYAKSLQNDKVLEVLAELKKSKVSPDNDSYRICISSFGLNYDLDGMESMLREMETQPHIVMDWCTYAVVAEFYERGFLEDKATDALKKAKMMLQKKNNRRIRYNLLNSDYENVIKSLVKLGELDKAMRFANEWEALGNWRTVDDISIPCTSIEEHIKNGSLLKAFYIINEWAHKGRTGIGRLSRLLCNEFIKWGNLFDAYDCFQVKGYMVGPLVVQRMFIQYLEEECGSFFPLRGCGSLCTRSLETTAGKTLLEFNPINMKYKLKVALLAHPKNSRQAINMGYENIIKSLVESGEFNEARKMAGEWEAYGNLTSLDGLNISKLIIDGYCKQNCFVEADGMVEAWTRERKPWAGGSWLILACHYQEEGKMGRGLECMRRFAFLTPWLKRSEYHLMFEMYVYMVQYSRGMMHLKSSEDYFSDLNALLCDTEDEFSLEYY